MTRAISKRNGRVARAVPGGKMRALYGRPEARRCRRY